jgi:membrane-bound serine protease (ClpP class)
MIDDGLFESIKRRTQQAIDSGGDYLIYEISTYGGLVKAADEISKYLIHNASQNARTVAYIKTEAISAGAMISVSCEDIIMRENTTIGDSAPITMGGKLEGVEREKAESFIRSVFDRAAQANGYPQALLRAMVSMGISVYRVENIKTGAYEYFQEQDLPDDANSFDIENKELVINDEQILTLTSADAFKYDISSQTVDDIEAALEFISERDNVRFSGLPKVLEPSWSEQMVRWINSPAVMGVLVMLAMLGVYMELSSPGLGLPGLVALICVVVIIGSKYLIDLANWIEIALFFTGVLLLFIELFVIPGFGVAGLSGILCVLAGIFGMMIKNRPDELPSLDNPFDWQIFMNSALGLGIGIFGFFILAWVFLKSIPKIKFLNGLSLEPPGIKMGASAGEAVSISAPTGTKPHNLQAGMKGKAIYNLHPTGKAEFENAIVDVVAQGEFIDKGVEVEITEIHGNRVVVKPVVEKG